MLLSLLFFKSSDPDTILTHLTVTKEFNWLPDSLYVVVIGSRKSSRQVVSSKGAKLRVLNCTSLKGKIDVDVTEESEVQFSIKGTSAKDRVECKVEYNGIVNHFSTPISVLSKPKFPI